MFLRTYVYRVLAFLLRVILFFWHPIFRVEGRENIPETAMMICCNHSGLADPLWVIFALRRKKLFHIMAKKEVMDIPVLGNVLSKFGVFGVDRGNQDFHAIKTAIRVLKSGESLLIFPEGTRVKAGTFAAPKTGAVMIAQRTGVPILPMYLTQKRFPLSALHVVIGQPYHPAEEAEKMTLDQSKEAAKELMARIYRLGEEI